MKVAAELQRIVVEEGRIVASAQYETKWDAILSKAKRETSITYRTTASREATKRLHNVAAKRVFGAAHNSQILTNQQLAVEPPQKCINKTPKNLRPEHVLCELSLSSNDKTRLRNQRKTVCGGRSQRSYHRPRTYRPPMRQTIEKQRVTTGRPRPICLTCPRRPFIIEIVANHTQPAQFVRSANVAPGTGLPPYTS